MQDVILALAVVGLTALLLGGKIRWSNARIASLTRKNHEASKMLKKIYEMPTDPRVVAREYMEDKDGEPYVTLIHKMRALARGAYEDLKDE